MRLRMIMSNELDAPLKRLTQKQKRELAAFTDPGTILSTLNRYGWTIEKSIEYLVKIAEDSTKKSVQLNAIKYLNQLTIDAMQRSGLMVTATRLFKGGEEEIKFTGHIVSNSLKNQKEGYSRDTQPEDLLPITVQKEQSNDESTEETEETEETETEIDTSLCKPPEGDSTGSDQFGGIAVAKSAGGPVLLL